MNILKLAGNVKDPSGIFSKVFGFFTGQSLVKKNSADFQKAIFQKKYGEASDELINLQSDKKITATKYADMQEEIIGNQKGKSKVEIKDMIVNKQKEVGYKGSHYKTDYEKKFDVIQENYKNDTDNQSKYVKQQEKIIDKNMLDSKVYSNQTDKTKMAMLGEQINVKRKKEKLNMTKGKQYKDYYIGNDAKTNAKRIALSTGMVASVGAAVTQPAQISSKLYEGQQRDRLKRQERKENIMSMTNFSMYKPQSYRQRVINIMNKGMR